LSWATENEPGQYALTLALCLIRKGCNNHKNLDAEEHHASRAIAFFFGQKILREFAKTPQEAAAVAAKIGFPVVIKLASATITHKTDVGGVLLNINSEKDVIQAFETIKTKLTQLGKEKEMDGVMIQKMVTEGVEAIIGVSNDPSFGHLIMFGTGGVNAELMHDVAFRLNPLTELDARELIGSIKMTKLFDGYRGMPPADKPALQELLLRLSAMVEDNPQISELDFNPVKVLPAGQGYWVVDARIAIG
jgi:acetyltransferase